MADQDHELQWRRQAIRLRLKGWRPYQILKRIPRKREWLRKWWRRFTALGWDGLHDRSRRPAHTPQAYHQQAHGRSQEAVCFGTLHTTWTLVTGKNFIIKIVPRKRTWTSKLEGARGRKSR